MKESKYLKTAAEQMAKAVAPTAGNYAFANALEDFRIGMQRTYNAPIRGKVEYYPNGPGHEVPGEFVATLEFDLYTRVPAIRDGKEDSDEICWTRTLAASGSTLEDLKADILKTMSRVEAHMAFVREAVLLRRERFNAVRS